MPPCKSPKRQRTCKLASLQMFARSACSQLWYNSWCLGLRQHLGHQQRLTLTLLTRCKMSDAGGSGTKLAGRRPDWALPSLHDGLKMDSHAPLEESTAAGRQQCPQCQRKRAWFCYDCRVALTTAPKLELPFKVSIVTHHEEPPSKNTGVQAAVIAPQHVELHDMEHFPADLDVSRCVVLFPSADAIDVEELEPDSIDRTFIIDSRWQKAGELLKLPAFAGMRHVKLRETRSAFWRFHTQGVSQDGVCTVECLYFFLKALLQCGKVSGSQYQNNEHAFDNLLWYFSWQHKVIAEASKKRVNEAPKEATETAIHLLQYPKHGMTKLQKKQLAKQLEQQQLGKRKHVDDGSEALSAAEVQSNKQLKAVENAVKK